MKRKEEEEKKKTMCFLLAVDHCKRPRTIDTIRVKTPSEGDKTHQITLSALKISDEQNDGVPWRCRFLQKVVVEILNCLLRSTETITATVWLWWSSWSPSLLPSLTFRFVTVTKGKLTQFGSGSHDGKLVCHCVVVVVI